jgi:hypothetical protein
LVQRTPSNTTLSPPRPRRLRVAPLLCAAVASMAGADDRESPAPVPAAREAPVPPRIERQQWAKDVDGAVPIRALEVRNDHGDIRARFTAEPRLEAFVVIQRLDPGSTGVGFTVERRGSVVALTATYPPGRVQDAEPDPPKAAFDRLDLTVLVPQGVALDARSLRGMIETRGLRSDVRAFTVAGPIFVSTSGAVHLRTVSGAIDAFLSLAPGPGPLLLESESGSISANLPAQADLDLRVESGGAVVSDFQLAARGGAAGPHEGRLGRGGRALLVYSASGRVEIRPLPPPEDWSLR